jgi:hypothetical protein
MGQMASGARTGRLAVLAASMIVVVALTVSAAGASGKPRELATPKCTRLSVHKLAELVHQPKMYLDHVGPLDASCIYYGVPRKIANQIPPSVASGKIKYHPSLMVSATRAPESFFAAEQKLFASQGLVGVRVNRKLGLGRHATAYHEVITSATMPPCDPMILYNNWTGPPSCNPQPSLEKVSVVAYQGPASGLGTLVVVSAAAQTPPTHLTELNVERIAKGVFTGKLP